MASASSSTKPKILQADQAQAQMILAPGGVGCAQSPGSAEEMLFKELPWKGPAGAAQH